MKIIYLNDCPVGKRYIMNPNTWIVNGKYVLPLEQRAGLNLVEVRHPRDRQKQAKSDDKK